MKEMTEMGLYGGFRSDFEFHGMKTSYSGTLSNGKDQIVVVKINFRSPERAVSILNLEATKESIKGRAKWKRSRRRCGMPMPGSPTQEGNGQVTSGRARP